MKKPEETKSNGYDDYIRHKESTQRKSFFDKLYQRLMTNYCENKLRRELLAGTYDGSMTNYCENKLRPQCSIPELKELTVEERNILDQPTIEFLSKVRDMIKSNNISCDVVYDKLYLNMPQAVVEEFTFAINDFNTANPDFLNVDESYEEIMKQFMKYSADINLPFLIIDSRNKIFNVVIKAVNLFKEGKYSTINEDVLPLKPVALAMLWALLMMKLVRKYTKYCTDLELKRIVKITLSIVISTIIGFTGYMHSGGFVGNLSSPTKIIKTCYTIQKSIEEYAPKFYNKIPEYLKFKDCHDFNSLIKSQQISASKGLNMTYTFRVGDSLLHNLSRNKYLDDGIIKKVFTSLWPLPTEEESKKMYQLYTDNKVYYL